ncbi:MAG: hypothetical protein CMJ84_01260 [Planctomycetes bacterium]|jgi:hypothetical protein|nr:hypothetical protein [Planctomycetota bacterium]MDP6408862.1 hypothetical protein [Planctomycetota bacterium]
MKMFLAIIALTIAALVAGQFWHAEPVPGGPTPSLTPRELFDTQVSAVLDRHCSACHGIPTEAYGAHAAGPESALLLRWPVDPSGRISNAELREVAYQRCSAAGATAPPMIDREGPALASPILIAPLSETYAGRSVVHPPSFPSPDDPDFVVLRRWVQAEIDAAPSSQKGQRTAAERFFGEEVVPVLTRKTCFGANCHGAAAFNDLRLHSGVPALEGRFTDAMHRRNRLSMLGEVTGQTRMVHVAGDVEQSRQLLKNIPIAQGGILHKGGNEFLERGDPDYDTLVRWLELEASEARQRTGAPLGEERGLVFVRRPRDTPQRYFEDDAFLAGGDLFWFHQGRELNLTAALHPDGPADIRAPDVSYDARRVVFSMRRAASEPFDVWELELDTGAARQLTFSSDPTVHFQDPQYVPDPQDASGEQLDRVALVMVSNRSGEWAMSSPEGILGEAEGGDRLRIVDEQLSEKPGTYDGHMIRVVRGTNRGQTRRVEHQTVGEVVVDQPFHEPCDSTTHYVIEVEPRVAASYDLYAMKMAASGQERETFERSLSRLTFGLGQIRRPSVRSSGEIMFTTLRTGWQSERPFYNGAIFRTFHNGANYHTHYGNRSVVPILSDDRELPNGLQVRVGRDADSYWGGALIISDHQFGPAIDPANPSDDLDHPFAGGLPENSLHQFFRGWIALDERVMTHGVSPGGAYRDPCPLPDGSLLVARAPGPVDLADAGAAPDFDIVRLVPDPAFQSADGLGAGTFWSEVVVGGEDSSELWPRPVVVRAKEGPMKKLKWATALFGEPETEPGRSGYPQGTPSQLLVFDLILLDAFFEQNLPAGVRHLREAICTVCGEPQERDEQVRFARVIGAKPLREGQSGPPGRYVIAEVPLEEDGSFNVVIPSEVSFDLQSLNADRMALSSPNRWLYTLPGEKHTLSIPRTLYAQTCNGCHGMLSGEKTTGFGRPDALTSASKTLAVWDAPAHRERPPANYDVGARRYLTDPYSVGFDEDIRPILERRCVRCHPGSKGDAGLDLEREGAFEALRRFVDHRQALAIKSSLVEILLGRELSAPEVPSDLELHPREARLEPEELRQIIRWIDLGARRERVMIR